MKTIVFLTAALSCAATLALSQDTADTARKKPVRKKPTARELAARADLVVSIAEATTLPRFLKPPQRARLDAIVKSLRSSQEKPALDVWKKFAAVAFDKKTKGYADRILRWVVREAYLETNQDLKMRADKVRLVNSRKRMLRTSTSRVRATAKKLEPGESAQVSPVDPRTGLAGKPRRMTKAEVEAHLEELDKVMQTLRDDAQLRQLQLQEAMQKNAQLMQMMSNIMKAWHDAAKSIIANMK